jgi:chromosome segregation ATPase
MKLFDKLLAIIDSPKNQLILILQKENTEQIALIQAYRNILKDRGEAHLSICRDKNAEIQKLQSELHCCEESIKKERKNAEKMQNQVEYWRKAFNNVTAENENLKLRIEAFRLGRGSKSFSFDFEAPYRYGEEYEVGQKGSSWENVKPFKESE